MVGIKAVALIPARAGSKRLRGKNALMFRGKPMISWSIEAALKSKFVDEVVISTDDPVILDIAEQYCVRTIDRSHTLATDTAQVKEVCLDFLMGEISIGRNWDILCCLYATSPLRKAEDVDGVIDMVRSKEAQFAMAVTEYSHSVFQALMVDEDSTLQPAWPNLVSQQSCTYPRAVVDNGSTYAVDVPAFIRYQTFYGPKLKGYYMSRSRSVDIDTQDDFDMALYYAQKQFEK